MTTYVGNPPKSVYGVKDATNIVYDHVTDGTETTLTIPNIDFENDHEYVIDISSNAATATALTLLHPDDSTRTNYVTMYSLISNGGAPTGGADSDSYLCRQQAGNILLVSGTIGWNPTTIGGSTGYLMWQTYNFYYQTTNGSAQYSGYNNVARTAPTSLQIVANAGGLIDAGMHIRITKREATNLVLPLEYSAPRKNILINSDFHVNQRGYVDGTATATGTGMYDRWVAWSSNTDMSVSGTIATIDHVTAATKGRMYQGIEAGQIIPGRQYTISWKGDATVSLWTHNGDAYDERTSPYTFIAGEDANATRWDYIIVNGDGATVSELKFEEGASATPWEKPDIATELHRCQRYYWSMGDILTLKPYSTSKMDVNIIYPTTMRTTPSYVISGVSLGTPSYDVSRHRARVIRAAAMDATSRYITSATFDAEI